MLQLFELGINVYKYRNDLLENVNRKMLKNFSNTDLLTGAIGKIFTYNNKFSR